MGRSMITREVGNPNWPILRNVINGRSLEYMRGKKSYLKNSQQQSYEKTKTKKLRKLHNCLGYAHGHAGKTERAYGGYC